MGTTLTGTTPASTYDSLIKVTDNGPLSGTLKTLTDGLGNDSALALSTGAASITGTLAVSSTSAFGGNVAINGSASSLDINPTTGEPNITLRSGNTFRGYIEGNASGGLSFGSGAAATIGMTLTTAGLGIGTASPSVALEVNGSVRFVDSTAAGPDLEFGNIGGSTKINNVAAANNYYGAYAHIFTNNDNSVERMRIDSTGNVGIGTSSPSNRVQSRRDATTDSSNSQFVAETRTGTVGQYAIYASRFDDGTGAGFTPIAFGAVQTATTGRTGDFVVAVSNTDNVNLSTHERLRITSAGNVGIGTSSPKGKLDVTHGLTNPVGLGDVDIDAFRLQGGGVVAIRATQYDAINQPAAGDTQFLNLYFNGSSYNYYERMRITASGNVGIGTDSPSTRLHIAGVNAWLTVQRTSGTTNIVDFTDASSNRIGYVGAIDSNITINAAAGNSIIFAPNNAEAGRFTSDGLTFNGDTAAANALDDYEEGTFTATLKGSVTDPTTPVTSTGTYTKIGRQVTINISFSNVDTTGAAGSVSVTGLPFTSSSSTTTNGSVNCFRFNFPAGTSVASYLGASDTILGFLLSEDTAGWSDLTHAAGTGRYLWVTHTYFV